MRKTLLLLLCALITALCCTGCSRLDAVTVPGSAERAPDRPGSTSRTLSEPLRASGVLEADEILIGAQIAGTVRWLGAEEGDEIALGDVLAELDTTIIDAQIREAQAALQTAKGQLAKVRSGARPEELAVADANVERAEKDVESVEAVVELAKGTVSIAQAKLEKARALYAHLQAGATPHDIASAQEQVTTTRDRMPALWSMRDAMGGQEKASGVPSGSYEAAQAAVAQGELSISIAELRLEIVQTGARPEDIKAAQAAMEAAQASVSAAQLQVDESQRRLEAARAYSQQVKAEAELLKAGASAEQIALAEAPARSAEVALRILEIRRRQATLIAPAAGLVLERMHSVGEYVLPATVLYRVAEMENMYLTVYVPGKEVGQIHPGQRVSVTVEAAADRRIDGSVVYVSPQAEYSPDVTTSDSATSSEVFAISIRVPNADRLLRPGMPARAEFTD